jgi:DNA polymerase III epsilon subunit-like protein/DNA-binding MarR family transcriptional regulator
MAEAPPTLAFPDTETTGLRPVDHDVWEIGIVLRRPGADGDVEYLWQVRPDLSRADPDAVAYNRFYERFVVPAGAEAADTRDPDRPRPLRLDELRTELTAVLDGAVFIANNAPFDAAFISKLLRLSGNDVPWHYRPVDVIGRAEGYLQGRDAAHRIRRPWHSHEVSRAVGVEPPGPDEAHCALPDARWVRDLWDAIEAHADPAAYRTDGTLLARVLADQGITQAELAVRTGISAKHVNHVAGGRSPVTVSMAVKLEEALGIPAMEWLRADAGPAVNRYRGTAAAASATPPAATTVIRRILAVLLTEEPQWTLRVSQLSGMSTSTVSQGIRQMRAWGWIEDAAGQEDRTRTSRRYLQLTQAGRRQAELLGTGQAKSSAGALGGDRA